MTVYNEDNGRISEKGHKEPEDEEKRDLTMLRVSIC